MCDFCEKENPIESNAVTGENVKIWTSPSACKTIFFTEYDNQKPVREYVLSMNYCPLCGRDLAIVGKHVYKRRQRHGQNHPVR